MASTQVIGRRVAEATYEKANTECIGKAVHPMGFDYLR